MNMFFELMSGFQVILQPLNLLYCFIGVFIGTLIGVLPGIGPVGAMSILLPTTFGLSPVAAIIMLAGIYYGAMYGGSTTSILVNIPGEAASVVTCLDGYQMARQGRAGPALGISALGSFIGGTFSIVALMFLVFPLAQAALKFGPPEYFSLVCMSMTVLDLPGQGIRAQGHRHDPGRPDSEHRGYGPDLGDAAFHLRLDQPLRMESGWCLWPWASSGYPRSSPTSKAR